MNNELTTDQKLETYKQKFVNFYKSYKIIIYLIVLALITLIISLALYFNSVKNKKILLSENYIQAKIYLENGEKNKAKNILKQNSLAGGGTYSILSFFLILNENLIEDQSELTYLFNQILENNKLNKEIKNLIVFKKALFQSNFTNELELLNSIKPLISEKTIWKPHALLLLGDFFVSNKEYMKAKEFYVQVLNIKNLNLELYEHARLQLILITNE